MTSREIAPKALVDMVNTLTPTLSRRAGEGGTREAGG